MKRFVIIAAVILGVLLAFDLVQSLVQGREFFETVQGNIAFYSLFIIVPLAEWLLEGAKRS
ncbi:MAG: hypothetical protein AAF226_12170 [Verrucomicrobiota bacterium]